MFRRRQNTPGAAEKNDAPCGFALPSRATSFHEGGPSGFPRRLSPLQPASRWRLPTIEIPSALRALVRARESSILFLGAAIGAVAGLIVAAMGTLVSLMHVWLFALPLGQRLSAAASLDPWRAIGVPLLGGLIFGLGLIALARWRPAREVDPIEANALYGGGPSPTGSSNVTAPAEKAHGGGGGGG